MLQELVSYVLLIWRHGIICFLDVISQRKFGKSLCRCVNSKRLYLGGLQIELSNEEAKRKISYCNHFKSNMESICVFYLDGEKSKAL